MDRIALNKMQEWDQSPNRKPLIVWGARQVGKTYLVKELFGKILCGELHLYRL